MYRPQTRHLSRNSGPNTADKCPKHANYLDGDAAHSRRHLDVRTIRPDNSPCLAEPGFPARIRVRVPPRHHTRHPSVCSNMVNDNPHPRSLRYPPRPPSPISESEGEPEELELRPRCALCDVPAGHPFCECRIERYLYLWGRPTPMSHHLCWPEDAPIPSAWIVCGPTGDADVSRIPQRSLANIPTRVPVPSCLMVDTSTPLPSFAVVIDCAPNTYTVRFFRDLEMFAGRNGPFDSCIPRLPYRGGKMSSETMHFLLTDSENEQPFKIWDGVPVDF